MMRTPITLAAILLVALAFTTKDEAQAGLTTYLICWIMPSGESDCAQLPRGYRIYGVRKPYCESPTCHRGTVSFTLTRSRISNLGRWVDTSSMFPTHVATIYAPK
jgi:hypothetical protein